MGETDEEREDRLYKESRSLKFQARALRKKRIEKEKEVAEAQRALDNQKAAEYRRDKDLKAKEARKDRDNRIRSALLEMANTIKFKDLAFESPSGAPYFINSAETKDAFILIDKVSGDRVQIRTQWNGFQWD